MDLKRNFFSRDITAMAQVAQRGCQPRPTLSDSRGAPALSMRLDLRSFPDRVILPSHHFMRSEITDIIADNNRD